MLPQGARVIVAVSGGADSVCLLHLLKALFDARSLTVAVRGPDGTALRQRAGIQLAGVAHLNHQLRAEASDEDEHFVANLAQSLDLPFYLLREPIADAQDNLEQAGHRARKRFFQSLRAEGKCDLIAIGHTRDDQAETVLFRLLRGSGLAGLSGIAPVGDHIIRPLIDVTRDQVRDFLRSRNIPWREDASNLDPRFARNRLRHDLLPQLARDWNPQIANALARLGHLARDEENYWTAEIDVLAREFVRDRQAVELSWPSLTALSKAVARRLIRRAIADAKGDLRKITYDHVESILAIHTRVVIPDLIVTRSFDWLRLEPARVLVPIEPIPIREPGSYPAPDGLTLIRVDHAQIPPPNPCANLELEAGSFAAALELRGWRPGDRYRPQGISHVRKIHEMFQTARVPCWRRDSWPIIISGDKILWSRKFGMAEEAGNFLRIGEITLS